MEYLMYLQQFYVDPESDATGKHWTHWQVAFENYVQMLYAEKLNWPIKFRPLSYLSHAIHELITDCFAYEEAIKLLQLPTESLKIQYLSDYLLLQNSKLLAHYLKELWAQSKDSNFQPMITEETHDKHIMDAFINGFWNAHIR